jgi:hypothetical protein
LHEQRPAANRLVAPIPLQSFKPFWLETIKALTADRTGAASICQNRDSSFALQQTETHTVDFCTVPAAARDDEAKIRR